MLKSFVVLMLMTIVALPGRVDVHDSVSMMLFTILAALGLLSFVVIFVDRVELVVLVAHAGLVVASDGAL